MEPQGTPNNQSNIEKTTKLRSHRNLFQNLVQNYINQQKVALAERQLYRPMK